VIVLVGGEKGGVGKTTLAVNLAARRAVQSDILLVDADKQASANLWAGIRREENVQPAVPCVQKHGKTLGAELRDLAGKYADILVDAGGRDSYELRAALTVAQVAIFPLQPSLFDAATLDVLSTLVERARAFNPQLVAGVLVNRASPNPRVSEAREAFALIETFPNLFLMETVARDRIAYRRSVRDGLAVHELRPLDPLAEGEMRSLFEEVFGQATAAVAEETAHAQ